MGYMAARFMYFTLLQQRLIASLRMRLRNGEITERNLARQIGASQPHIHNVLKGERILTPKLADRILRQLGISVLDLLEEAELAGRPASALPSGTRPPADTSQEPPERSDPN